MRVRLKLINMGKSGSPFWWIIAQPCKKKLQGLYLEKLGIWTPLKRKTVPRQITLNKHRMRYWLSVGATPTKGVNRLLTKFDFVPPMPKPFGERHAYDKPEKTYAMNHFRGMGFQPHMSPNKIALFYKQQLIEQMNIVERKRRLQAEAMANLGADQFLSAQEADLDGEDTDGMESDEPDVFERKRKFETLLEKLNKHRNKTQLTLKGNDLRFNVYLKKMDKLTRSDLGLDFAAYKDYVSNLREFAHVNRDMDVFANESLSFAPDNQDKQLLQAAADFEGFNPDLQGAKRVKEHGPSVQLTVAKLMRKSSAFLNDRDRAALKELRENIGLYLLHDLVLFDQLMRLYYREKANSKVDQKHVEMLQELKNDLPIELMEECGVSKREFEQMQLLLEINPNIFHLDDPEGKHSRPHITHSLHPNPYSHFIDFTQIKESEKLPKEVKNILFRPQKLARLGEVYKKLALKLTNSFERKRLEAIDNQHVKYKRVGFQARYPRKQADEYEAIKEVVALVEKTLASNESAMSLGEGQQKDYKVVEEMAKTLKISKKDQHEWYDNLLTKLIRERRQMPKAERLKKYRTDAIDAVDTTDLESWQFRIMRVPLDQQEEEELKELEKRRAFANKEIAADLGENLEEVFEENGKMYKKQTVHKHFKVSKTMEQEYSNLFLRHRLDFVRSVFDGEFDSALALRKFKHIYKKEMKENKHLYLKKGEKQPKLSETETVLSEVLEPTVVDEELLNEMKSDVSSEEAEEEERKSVEEEFAMEDGGKSDKEHSFKSDRSDKEGASDIESDFEGEADEYDDNFLAEFEADLKSLTAELQAQGVKVPEGGEENDFDDLSDETIKELRDASMKKFKKDIKEMFEDPMADTAGIEHLKEDDAVDQLLKDLEAADFNTEEEMQAYYLKTHQQYAQIRVKFREEKGHTSQFYKDDKKDPIDLFLEREKEITSRYENFVFVDQEEYNAVIKKSEDNIGRYPHGFRHYENFNSYKFVNKDADISEYISKMNEPCTFENYVTILKAALNDEKKTAYFKHEFAPRSDDEEEPMSIEEFMASPMFEEEARAAYDQVLQQSLLDRQVYTFADAIHDQVNLWEWGKNKFKLPVYNTYVPVKHTIMPKPSLTDGNDELGFRFNDPMDRSKPQVRINPIGQLNPLKGFRMAPSVGPVPITPAPARKQFPKNRRLSHPKVRFSTVVQRPVKENRDPLFAGLTPEQQRVFNFNLLRF